MQNSSETWTVVTIRLLELAATWWLQAAILLMVGFAAASCFRRPALQSVIYRVTMGAVLMCPLLTLLLSNAGISLLTVDLRWTLASELNVDSSSTTQQAKGASEIGGAFEREEQSHESSLNPSLRKSFSSAQITVEDARFDGGALRASNASKRNRYTQFIAPTNPCPSPVIDGRSVASTKDLAFQTSGVRSHSLNHQLHQPRPQKI